MVLVESDGAGYHNMTCTYTSSCTDKPKAVFVPKTEDGLKAVVQACVKHGVETAVTTMRLNQNCMSTTTGYMINMRLFQTIELDKDKMQVRVGAGWSGDEVNSYLHDQGEYHTPGLVCTWGGSVGPIFGGGVEWHTIAQWGGNMADHALEFRFMDYKE